jgi:hypothetical protein
VRDRIRDEADAMTSGTETTMASVSPISTTRRAAQTRRNKNYSGVFDPSPHNVLLPNSASRVCF